MSSNVTELFPAFMREDLEKSGLVIADLNARPLTATERHATGSPQAPDGYVVPYYSIGGSPLPFYRVRLSNWDPKYKQLTDEPNHIYFPKGFWDLANDPETTYILFTEGEKKAALMQKKGFACAAAGGVDSWSNKTVSLPKDTKLAKGRDNRIIAKLTTGDADAHYDELANGMKDLIQLLIRRDIPLIIIYDSDDMGKVRPEVQAAAARLGYSLRFHGVQAKHIRQFILTPPKGFMGDKLGLDDLFIGSKIKPSQFEEAIAKVIARPSAFPRHPNPREYINKKLRKQRMTRENLQSLATSILCDLDANGTRLYSKDEDDLYYFSRTNKRLMKVTFRLDGDYAKSPWGVFLYQHYNLSAADERVLIWLEALFAGEEPVMEVNPERVIATRDNAIYYQINGAQMIKVTSKEIRVLDNGSDDILFLSDAVEDLDKGKVVKEINRLLELDKLPNYWFNTAREARLLDNAEYQQAKLLSYLYHVSPWFYRWRGTQLPVEMVIGEPGTGKSSLYQLRLNVLNGNPRLRNPAKDIGDWSVSVGNSGALHVTDNINMMNSQLRQQISDEMCRLVTEPKPTIEKRKLYTDNTIVQIPVKTIFAITSVKQPFNAPDIIQRSIITFMNKGSDVVEYKGSWADDQLAKYGGREGWIAQELVFIHRMLQRISKEWQSNYRAKIRLINLEQLLRFAARMFGDDDSWIVAYMESTQAAKIAEGDLVLGALRRFSELCVAKFGEYATEPEARFTVKNIAEWALNQSEYKETFMLTNTRSLGRYMKDNPNLLATVAGISEHGSKNNAIAYHAHDPKK